MRCSKIAGLLASAFGLVAAQDGIIRGVNLGGWLVGEPWITPTVFNTDGANASCEWDLCNFLGKEKALSELEAHWSTFYVKSDLEEIVQAGLTHIRIPLGYWAVVPLIDDEPYVQGQYPYLIQAVQWAQELGLKVMIDLHGAPGSQNGWEETGLVGPVEFPVNTSNSDRALQVLTNLTTEFSKDTYGGTVVQIECLNEPTFDDTQLKAFYTAAYEVISVANSSGINFTYHDAFYQPWPWENYNPIDAAATEPATYTTLDTHQFWGFPPLELLTEEGIFENVCAFGTQLKNNSQIPYTVVGEWSLDTGITANDTSDSADNVSKRTWFRSLFEAQAAAYTPNAPGQSSIGWYYWAWKTEYDIDAWSYRKGWVEEYIPSNVSDPSTYVYPVLDNGCIDQNFTYTAPASVPTFSADSGSPTGSATGSSASASSTKKSSAGRISTEWLSKVGVVVGVSIVSAYL